MTMPRTFAAAVVAFGVLVVAPVASADRYSDVLYFKSPSGNLRCAMQQSNTGRNAVYCSTYRPSTKSGKARLYRIKESGRAGTGTIDPRLKTQSGESPVVTAPYNKTLYLTGGTPKLQGTARDIRCTIRRTGITCRNRSGNGFVLRIGYARRF